MSTPPDETQTGKPRRELRGAHRYGYVLLLVLASFFVLAAGGNAPWVKVVAAVLQACTLLVLFLTAGVRPHLRHAAATGFVVSVLVVVLSLFGSDNLTRLTTSLVSAVLVLVIAWTLVRAIGVQPEINIRTVYAAVTVYILIGLCFAYVYAAIDILGSEPFFADGRTGTTSHYLYFSYVTQTTVGYGDFVANTDLGRTLAIVEALLGQLYLVTVVALIVGNLGRQKRARDPQL